MSNIEAFGHEAKFFEEEDIQNHLREAIWQNNLEYSGLCELDNEVQNKKSVELKPQLPPNPMFQMTSYKLQSYLSTLIR